MEHTAPAPHAPRKSHTTPKNFFLWLTAIIGLYASITAFFTLIFRYIDLAFPDPLAYYSDPFSTGMRIAMATLIVMVPTFLGILMALRRDIVREPGKADIWVRHWALILTIFIAGITALVDLITLLTSFLGGDLTTPFALKALVVLLLALLVCFHFLADYWGYWTLHRRKVNLVGAAVGALALMTVIGGFMLIGSPSHIRALRTDQERVNDLQSIQSEVINTYQQKRSLPQSLDALNDPLRGYTVPVSPAGDTYEYVVKSTLSFELCATFETESDETKNGKSPYYGPEGDMYVDSTFNHPTGHACFTRTIDPEKYPAYSGANSKSL